jgi:hypothetical protein
MILILYPVSLSSKPVGKDPRVAIHLSAFPMLTIAFKMPSVRSKKKKNNPKLLERPEKFVVFDSAVFKTLL